MNKWEIDVQRSLLDSEAAALKELEKQYAAALKDINDRVKLFQADIDLLDDALSQDGLSDAKRKRLQTQKRSKIYQKQYQEALQGQIGVILDKMHGDNYSAIEKYLKDSYETGFVGTMYDIHRQGVPVIVPMDQAATVRAVLLDSKVSGKLYKRLGIEVSGLKKTITQEISRGIASGLGYNDIARNLANTSKAPLNRTKIIIRTEGHRIQQTSTADAQQAAKDKGADVVKQWDSTLDGKTRDSHRQVDGEIRELDEKFSNGLMYPGDPNGPAAEVINCRCVSLTRARWALNEAELKTLQSRAKFYGLDKTKNFDEFKRKYIEAGKMAVQSGNNWENAEPRIVPKSEKRALIEYAETKNIRIGSITSFDGDADLLRGQIDTLDKMQNMLPLGKRLSFSVSHMDDDDFGITSQTNISVNVKVLRNRRVTIMNIREGNMFASKTVEDIAAHEYGHVFTMIKGNKGIEIAKRAYYNTYSRACTNEEIIDFLRENISMYCVTQHGTKFKEIIPEVLAKHNSSSDDFTAAFVELLKGV